MRARDALILYLAAKRATKQQEDEGRLVWSSSTAEYYYDRSGRPVSGRLLRGAWGDYVRDMQGDLERATDRMLGQRMSVEAYRQALRDHAKDMTRIGYMTGRGGHAQMTNIDWLAVAREVKRQNHYIDRFAGQLAAGTAGTEGQIRTRAKLYGQAGYRTMEEGQRAAKDRAGYTEERRNAVMDNNTCARCAELAGLGWQPIGSLPLPGEDTPCGGNCRCELEYRGNPIVPEEEAAYLYDKLTREYEAEGFSGFTYDVLTSEEPAEGFALSLDPARERIIPLSRIKQGDLLDYIDQNADLLTDQTKFPHKLGGWTDKGNLYLDVSTVIPSDQIERAARYVVEYNQLAMYSLHEGKEIGRDMCINILQSAGILPPDYQDPMKKTIKRSGRRATFFLDPVVAGTKNPRTGDRYTFAEMLAYVYDLGQYLHREHGAELMTPREGLVTIVKAYRAHEEHDIEEFWQLRPDLRPGDWAEHKEDYMSGRWDRLAWDD